MAQDPILLQGRYELSEVIGRGGMAEVWRGKDRRLGRDIAVKRLRADLASDETFQARFRREAQSAAGLNHPNIVAVYDTGEEIDETSGVALPYIVMELVEGHTLREILRDGRKILPEKALEFTGGILDALNYSHRAGIIHRDIKPGNVMITKGGQVKVMDFGIARAVADTQATMTQTAAVIGTAQYLSPEQARGETVDNRSDIYSTGCLLYELLTGRPPFQGDSPVSVAYQHVRELPTPPSELDDEITGDMDKIVLKSLAKDPNNRYQTAREMRDDIIRLLAGEDVTAIVPAGLIDEQATSSAVTPAVSTPDDTTSSAAVSDPLPEPDKGMSTGTKILIGLLIALLIGAGFGIWRLVSGPETHAVPNLSGSTEAVAKSMLENSGFELGEVTHTNGAADASVDTVIDQDPKAQSQHVMGTKVNITVNDGPKSGTLPDVRGKPEQEAVQILNNEGFSKVSTSEANPQDEPVTAAAGTVVAMQPAANSNITPDTQIELTIATGTSPLPNLVGSALTETEAKKQLEEAGFTLGKYELLEGPDDETKGQVVKQEPSADKPVNVKRGTPVAVTVNGGPKTAAVPDLRGKSSEAAREALKAAGFLNVEEQAADYATEPATFGKGAVISVTPTPGTTVPTSTTIVITVAQGVAKVPNFNGTTLEEAQHTAKATGFTKPLVVRKQPSDSTPAGQIFAQNPEREKVVDKNTEITVTVSTGRDGKPSGDNTP